MTVVGTSTGFSNGTFSTLTLDLTKPFRYDPRKGNLLLEIQKDQSSCDGDGPIYVDGSSNADGVSFIPQQFGVFPHTGMTVGFERQVLVPLVPGSLRCAPRRQSLATTLARAERCNLNRNRYVRGAHLPDSPSDEREPNVWR